MVDFSNLGVLKGKCHESAMNLPWKTVTIHCIIFMWYSYQTHATFMALSWRFHGTFMPLSCQFSFQPRTWLPKQFHAIFMADSWHFLPLQNCQSQVNQIHVTFIYFHVTFIALSFKVKDCHYQSSRLSLISLRESAMKVLWNCHETVWSSVCLKVTWIRDESDIAVKLTWKWHESAMNLRWIGHSG